jgi:hypothetical protein
MSKKPKIEHDYNSGKDKLTTIIHRYSLKSKETRNDILKKLMANLESKPTVSSPMPRRNRKKDHPVKSCVVNENHRN